ncbi:MAG: hypothetical protein HYY84_11610 [Deltaproteobacteria bacterium]|nr:hypothetical protein [Deltaproteobacteria bacterium]
MGLRVIAIVSASVLTLVACARTNPLFGQSFKDAGGDEPGTDAGPDAGGDAGPDGGSDAGFDAGSKTANGGSCATPNDCASGFCWRSTVCCATACNAPCERCNTTDAGTCVHETSNQNAGGLNLSNAADSGYSAYVPAITAGPSHYVVSWIQDNAFNSNVIAQSVRFSNSSPDVACLPIPVSDAGAIGSMLFSSVAARNPVDGRVGVAWGVRSASWFGRYFRYVDVDAGGNRGCLTALDVPMEHATAVGYDAGELARPEKLVYVPTGDRFYNFFSLDNVTSSACQDNRLCETSFLGSAPSAATTAPVRTYAQGSYLYYATDSDRRNYADHDGTIVGLFYVDSAGNSVFNRIDPAGGAPASIQEDGPSVIVDGGYPMGIAWNAALNRFAFLYGKNDALVVADNSDTAVAVTSVDAGALAIGAAAFVATRWGTQQAGWGVVWVQLTLGGKREIVFRGVGASGSPTGLALGVAATTVLSIPSSTGVFWLDIAAPPDGGPFGVVWADNRHPNTNSDIFFSAFACY